MEREWTMKLNLITGDLFAVGCDAWVNPADTKLSGSGGLDKIFHQKCGPALSRELAGKQLNPLEVLVTSGCGLPVRYILHAAVPRQSQETGAVYEQLETCCRNIVVQASRQRGLRHLAMPLIGTGYAGYSLYSPFYPGLLCGTAAVAILAGIIRGMHQVGGIAEGISLREITVVCSSEANRVYMQKVWRVMVGQGLDTRSRVRGCLLGGALGDALGYPLEFLNPYEFPESIQMAWKKAEDIRILDKETGKAVISVDTQMTLLSLIHISEPTRRS